MPATILIVEDHDAVRKALRDWLAVEFPQCRVVEATCGEDALALVQRESPRLVVMDITLPGMTGIQATRQIKALSPSTQIVMLTMYEDDAYRAAATSAGASAYVPKRRMQAELVPALSTFLAG